MFVTIAQQRLDARAEYQQGEEQSRLRERLRTDYCLADFIQCEIDAGEIDTIIKDIKRAHLAYLIRKVDKLLLGSQNYFKIALDLAEDFEHYFTEEELKDYHNKLIEKAIDNEYEITKE